VNSVGSGAKLPESDREDMEIFLQKIQQILPILGIEAFVDGSASAQDEICEREMLYCNIKGLKASGFLNPNGMIVVKGATIHGGSANGLTAWVNNDGVSLKAIQAT